MPKAEKKKNYVQKYKKEWELEPVFKGELFKDCRANR